MTSGYTRFSAKILHVKHKSGINIDKHEIRKAFLEAIFLASNQAGNTAEFIKREFINFMTE